jgi:hypothetical protein
MRYVILAAILLVVLAAAIFAARPAYRSLKKWQAHRFVRQAEAMIADNQWQAAYRKAQAALQLSPLDAQSLRLMARLLTLAGHEQALPYWNQLLLSPESTDEDRFQTVAVALRTRQFETAGKLLNHDLQKQPVPTRALLLTSEFFAAQGDPGQALRYARAAVQASPGDTTNNLFLAQRLLSSTNQNEQLEGRRVLAQVAASDDRMALDAALLLSRFVQLSPEETRLCILKLTSHPDRTLAHEFRALDLRLRTEPDKRAELFTEETRKYRSLGDEALVELGRWLNRNREYQRVLEVIPADKAPGSQDLFLVHVDAIAGLGRWSDLEVFLNRTDIPLEPHVVAIYRVRVAKELGRTQLVPLYWSQAHQRAAERPDHLLYLAQYAELMGAPEEAIKAYQRLAENPQSAQSAYVALLRLTQQTGSTRDLRDVLRDMHKAFPNDPRPQNDLAYLNILLGENLQESRQLALELHQKNTNTPVHRVTLAFAHLRLNEPAKARELIQIAGYDWSTAPPPLQAVRAAVLGSTGDASAAREIARRIPPGALKPEERSLIQPWL